MQVIHLRITGSVQGVFFRSEAKRKADELGLVGWVRNCADGSVEVFAQGKESALKNLEKWCWKGPAGAEVTDVTTRKAEPAEQHSEFQILY